MTVLRQHPHPFPRRPGLPGPGPLLQQSSAELHSLLPTHPVCSPLRARITPSRWAAAGSKFQEKRTPIDSQSIWTPFHISGAKNTCFKMSTGSYAPCRTLFAGFFTPRPIIRAFYISLEVMHRAALDRHFSSRRRRVTPHPLAESSRPALMHQPAVLFPPRAHRPVPPLKRTLLQAAGRSSGISIHPLV